MGVPYFVACASGGEFDAPGAVQYIFEDSSLVFAEAK
jgi:hypothetical protein